MDNAVLFDSPCSCLSNAMHWTDYKIMQTCPVSVRRLWAWLRRYLWTDLHQIWNTASPYLTGV